MTNPMRIYPDGTKQAILAMSFFRSRHERRNRFANSDRHKKETVPVYREHARLARHYIDEARKYGFRGSVIRAIEVTP
jgi:hypothetical protein